ncbi:Peptidase S58 DmpA/arginine biosynthesis protein ArgJ [Penicillium cf. griseofulvum]|uniref:Peptidase S58 DmpA/arginine biosynthesis protein ArgJ n=1 Tax=Penicillium cf. griseofulvum TaxID=2972120 RepID=A0A9W9IXL8_9EURO|nr:Peptidase S58 DmpA/arginine biosynthesis protein ArgJ [Penicillium cf. griseofulvum]
MGFYGGPRPNPRWACGAFSTKFDKFGLYGGRPIPANKQRLIPTSGSWPKGFNVGNTRAEIKPAGTIQPDLLIVASDTPASGALMRRTNSAGLRGVIANLGGVNTLNDQAGLDDSIAMGHGAAKCISTGAADEGLRLMVMHTGAGAQRLPIDNILHHIPELTRNPNFPSLASLKASFLLRGAASKSYNCISIDGHTSTNDMVAMFANGAAASSSQPAVNIFPAPTLVVRDAEGASKFITIRRSGRRGIYGLDSNWPGILAALGYSLLDTSFARQGIIIAEQTSVSFMDGSEVVKFLDRGVPVPVDEARIKQIMEKEDLETIVDLRHGMSKEIIPMRQFIGRAT